MYFELVLIYPALRFINDISLMNFSAQTSRRPFICCNSLNQFSKVFMFLCSSFHSIVSILFVSPGWHPSVAFCFPVFVGTAKVEIFFILSSFFFFYFLKAETFFKSLRKLNHFLLYNLSNPSLFISCTVSLPPKRDAKVGKINQPPNNSTNSFVYRI